VRLTPHGINTGAERMRETSPYRARTCCSASNGLQRLAKLRNVFSQATHEAREFRDITLFPAIEHRLHQFPVGVRHRTRNARATRCGSDIADTAIFRADRAFHETKFRKLGDLARNRRVIASAAVAQIHDANRSVAVHAYEKPCQRYVKRNARVFQHAIVQQWLIEMRRQIGERCREICELLQALRISQVN
jgi:hypothetical protein